MALTGFIFKNACSPPSANCTVNAAAVPGAANQQRWVHRNISQPGTKMVPALIWINCELVALSIQPMCDVVHEAQNVMAMARW